MTEPIGLVFPGQGAQFVGMGKDLNDAFPEASDLFDMANEIMGISLTEIMWNGPEETLRETRFTQPAILAHSLAALRVVENAGLPGEPHVAAGHSLGEYSGLVAAGVISERDAFRLVKRRGELMQNAGQGKAIAMAALIGISSTIVDDIVLRSSQYGIVVAANRNAPDQTVVSGEEHAVQHAMTLAENEGAKRTIRLSVGGAFHSPLMGGVGQELSSLVLEVDFNPPRFPTVPNVTATPTQDPKTIQDCLIKQIESPVLWSESVQAMVSSLGVGLCFELGPGRVLSGLIRRIDRSVRTVSIGDVSSLRKLNA